MGKTRFAAAINCMDGRVQLPVIEFLRNNYNVDYVDLITEAGPDGLMASGDSAARESIRRRVMVSVEKHGAKLVAIAAHDDCAGNPVSKSAHLGDLTKALAVIESWNLPVKTIGLWVDSSGRVSAVD
jgi:hypothetical protein